MIIAATQILTPAGLQADCGIEVDAQGRIARIERLERLGTPDHHLHNRVLLPGFVNAHSHAFQRFLRGRTQSAGDSDDNFWSWREAMYAVTRQISPEALHCVARQLFIEMLLSGVTAVGEFHYLHHQVGGVPYDNSAQMAESLARAALDAGIRLTVLRTVYLRGDFDEPPSEHQLRFCEGSYDVAWDRCRHTQQRLNALQDERVSFGVAAHSIRAVSIEAMARLKSDAQELPFHLHISEQPREVEGCVAQYGLAPIQLVASRRILDSTTTLVHATHLRDDEPALIANSGATVCVCPSTEADLGDGLIEATPLAQAGVPLCLGTDGETLSSIGEEARRLEMHERLRTQRRNLLTDRGSVADFLLKAATKNGADALQLDAGEIAVGRWADLVAYDLNDPNLAGSDEQALLANILLSSDSRAVTDVFVAGRPVVQQRVHPGAEASRVAFEAQSARLFCG